MLSSELIPEITQPISLEPQVCCGNPRCSAPLNALGQTACASCQTPLTYRYLWAVGDLAEQTATGAQIAGRYYVAAPNVWLDTQPSLTPDIPLDWSDTVLPYLHLYPQALHIPQVYGFCPAAKGAGLTDTFLLENAPLDASGNLLPGFAQLWSAAPAVRQVYWLWQILQLWQPLQTEGVACSLLITDNLRVDGWRVRLRQLYADAEVFGLPATAEVPSTALLKLADLGNFWLEWVERAQPSVVDALRAVCQSMQAGHAFADVSDQLNQVLLTQAAALPLRLRIAGITDAGPDRPHNEDACYPLFTPLDLNNLPNAMPRLAIVCDGIGGHEGGEVASQMAVQSFRLQAQALLAEVADPANTEPMTPAVVTQQLESIVRIVNNLIATQNDRQGRTDRRRMGTTLALALQLPQPIKAADDTVLGHSHELYLVHVGDSRAYWITERYCHCLTVDDDVAGRETRLGRSLHREALARPDASALTQALGTRDADQLRPTVQRFILEEDGILLLCSDGLSDNNWVETYWAEFTEALMRGQRSLAETAQAWIDLANQKNGYDNSSVVLLQCNVSSTALDPALPPLNEPAPGWAASSQALLDEESLPFGPDSRPRAGVKAREWVPPLVGFLMAVAIAGGIGLFVWNKHKADPVPSAPTLSSPVTAPDAPVAPSTEPPTNSTEPLPERAPAASPKGE